jgi:hypothetical protein
MTAFQNDHIPDKGLIQNITFVFHLNDSWESIIYR